MILEEDNDDIPLIEVHTGDKNGRPVLVALHPGQYSKELAILRKNLGNDGFGYTEKKGYRDIFGAAPDEEEDFPLSIHEFEDSIIGISEAGEINTDELMDDELIKSRSVMDQLTLSVERFLRALPAVRMEYFTDLDQYGMLDADWDHILEGLTVMPGSPAFEINPADDYDRSWMMELVEDDPMGDVLLEKARTVLERNRDNVIVLFELADFLIPTGRITELPELVEELRELTKDYLLPRIILARIAADSMGTYPADELPEAYSKPLPELFPGFDGFDTYEYFQYFLLQLQLSLDRNDVRNAIRAYKGLADIDEWSYSLMGLQARFGGMLQQLIGELVDENGDPR